MKFGEQVNLEEGIDKIRSEALCGDCVIDLGHLKHHTKLLNVAIKSYTEFAEKINQELDVEKGRCAEKDFFMTPEGV